MDDRLQRRIQRYGWDKAVKYYERGWRRSLYPAQSALLKLADAAAGQKVLDVACGTGLVSFPLAASVGEDGEVLATDISGEMIEHINSVCAAKKIGNVQTLRTSSEDQIKLETDRFDLVTCALGLMYFPDPHSALTEMYRVLKPGGKIVCAVWGARKSCGWAEIFPIVDARVKSAVCPMFFHLGSEGALEFEYRNAGFQVEKKQRISTSLFYESAQDAVDAAFIGGPVALAYNRFSASQKHEAEAEYVKSISRFKRNDGYHIPGEFVICSGLKPMSEPSDARS
jgi:ubiquinone/menaquinone biosynthesis C-methylase UbiE